MVGRIYQRLLGKLSAPQIQRKQDMNLNIVHMCIHFLFEPLGCLRIGP